MNSKYKVQEPLVKVTYEKWVRDVGYMTKTEMVPVSILEKQIKYLQGMVGTVRNVEIKN